MSPVRSVRWQSCFSWTSDENSWEMSPRRATPAMCSDDDVTNSQSPPVDHEGYACTLVSPAEQSRNARWGNDDVVAERCG
ncbi:unnamed protein product [Sphagnum jensenii]|uniref:Uncharacterized protein n=1 Tax=Sphagnum jensenii TaxID=128206 RepID=A0ABP0W766_9BRYO